MRRMRIGFSGRSGATGYTKGFFWQAVCAFRLGRNGEALDMARTVVQGKIRNMLRLTLLRA